MLFGQFQSILRSSPLTFDSKLLLAPGMLRNLQNFGGDSNDLLLDGQNLSAMRASVICNCPLELSMACRGCQK